MQKIISQLLIHENFLVLTFSLITAWGMMVTTLHISNLKVILVMEVPVKELKPRLRLNLIP